MAAQPACEDATTRLIIIIVCSVSARDAPRSHWAMAGFAQRPMQVGGFALLLGLYCHCKNKSAEKKERAEERKAANMSAALAHRQVEMSSDTSGWGVPTPAVVRSSNKFDSERLEALRAVDYAPQPSPPRMKSSNGFSEGEAAAVQFRAPPSSSAYAGVAPPSDRPPGFGQYAPTSPSSFSLASSDFHRSPMASPTAVSMNGRPQASPGSWTGEL